jgi:hypothetical protein
MKRMMKKVLNQTTKNQLTLSPSLILQINISVLENQRATLDEAEVKRPLL